jgi:8-oxo-dGTP pyrophosphatase MutT (NUDIX family)
MLIIRPRWDSPDWNIPKGELKEGESYKTCALREIKEETGVKVSSKSKIMDLGLRPYLKKKDVYLFSIHLVESDVPAKLICSSFFEENGKQTPEVVDFKWVIWDEATKLVSEPIYSVLQSVYSDIE